MLRRALVLASLAAIQGCATPPLVEETYTGPIAIIADTATGGGRSGGVFFILAEMDGKPVATSLGASIAASSGQGPNLQLRQVERTVKAGPTKLKLAGRIGYAAPIQQMFSSAASREVEGVIDVDLKANTRYRVNGNLDAFRREVWLEDAVTNQIVGQKIVNLADAKATAVSAADASFTCCNLHYQDDWISDGNWTTQPFIPAGSRIKVNDYGGRYRANVMIEGRPMRIGLDWGRAQESTEKYVSKLVVKDDPNLRIATFPANVQAAIRAGKVMAGMTKEHVIISLGYPRTDGTRSLDLNEWTYWADEKSEFAVIWDSNQRVKEISGAPRVARLVTYSE